MTKTLDDLSKVELADEIVKRDAEIERLRAAIDADTKYIALADERIAKLQAVVGAAKELRATDRYHDLCMNNAQLEHSQILCADCKLMEALAALEDEYNIKIKGIPSKLEPPAEDDDG